MLPLFLIAVAFVMLSPIYWMATELPPGRPIPQAYENGVLYQRVFPFFEYAFGRLRNGELPLWNPQILCGAPFLADPVTAVFQPLSLVFLFLTTQKALAAHAFLCLTMMGAGTALLLRGLGTRYLSALFGGIVFACSGAAAAGLSRPDIAATLAWMPFLFWAVREHVREFRIGFAVISGVCTAMLLLGGNIAVATAVILFVYPYGMLRGLLGHDTIGLPVWRRLSGFGIAGAVALGVAAIQYLPTIVWAAELDNPYRALFHLELAGAVPDDVRELLGHLLSPRQDRLPRVMYLGIIPLLTIPAAFVHPYGKLDALLLGVGALFGVLLALGSTLNNTVVLALLIPAALALSVIAALGLDKLLATTRDPRSPLVWGPVLVMLIVAGLLFYATGAEARGRLLIGMVLLLPVLVVRLRWLSAACAICLSGLVFADLAIANVNYYEHPYNDAPQVYAQHAKTLNEAAAQALGGRTHISSHTLNNSLTPSIGMLFPVAIVGGVYVPLTQEQASWWRELGWMSATPIVSATAEGKAPQLLNVMAARVFIDGAEGPDGIRSIRHTAGMRPVATGDGTTMYVNDEALRRAYWVPFWRVVADVEAAIDVLVSEEFDPTEECTVTGAGETIDALARTVPDVERDEVEVDWESVSCVVVEERAEYVHCAVEASRPGVMVLADSFASGWKVYVDGARAPLLKVNGIFRGVPVADGKHHVEFRYRPASLRVGMFISFVTLAVLVAVAVRNLIGGRAMTLRPETE